MSDTKLATKSSLGFILLLAVIGLGFGVGLTLNFWPSSKALEVNLPSGDDVSSRVSRDFILISQGVLPSVVSISGRGISEEQASKSQRPPAEDDQNEGSGVVVDSEKGYILTNNHVIENAKEIYVQSPDGQEYLAEVVGTDPPTDLAVIQVKNAQLKAAKLGDSSALKVGEWVLAIGSPFGLKSSVTAGIISAKGRADVGVADFEDFIQTDAAINPGNSGGALINIHGEVIGINTAIATRSAEYMGIGFAIPSNMAQKVMRDLIEKGKVTRSQLGIFIGPLDKALLKSLQLTEEVQGILVMEVIKNSPAEAAGFKKYDVIVRLNAEQVTEVNAFRNQIAMTSPGEKVEIEVLRQGKKQVLSATLKESSGSGMNPLAASEENEIPALGFEVEALTPEIKAQFGLPTALAGVIVTSVENNGPAAGDNGLQHGDIITEFNREPVTSLSDFENHLRQVKSGDALLLGIIRQQQSRVIGLKVP